MVRSSSISWSSVTDWGARQARPIRSCDLLPAPLYETLRPRLQPLVAQIRRRRRVLLGPNVTVLFENRETVLWHVHEVLRIEGRASADRIAEELEHYNCLVAAPGEIRATILIDGGSREEGERLSDQIVRNDDVLELRVGGARCVADCVESRAERGSPVRYVRFPLDDSLVDSDRLLDLPVQLWLYGSPPSVVLLPEETRRALALDVGKSTRSFVIEAAE